MFSLISNKIFLGVFFILSFNIFHFFPEFSLIKDAWIIYIFIYLVIVILCKQILDGKRYSSFEVYIFSLCFMTVYSAFMAYLEFDQPLVYGFFSQRNLILIVSSLMLIYWVENKKVTLENVDKAMPAIGWFCLVLYLAMIGILNPVKFIGAVGFVGGGVTEPVHFIFNSVFIIYSILYYFLRGLKNSSIFSFVAMLVFLVYLIFIDGGRSKLLSLLIVIFIILFKKIPFSKLILFSPLVIIIIGSLSISIYYYNNTYLDELFVKFNDAISVVITAEKSSDASANARIDEVNMASPYIEKNWLFGNGFLSHQWKNGFLNKIGVFAPSDIGLIGNVFVYGIVGVLIFLWQFIFAWKFIKLIPKDNTITLVEGSKYFLLFYFIHSLSTGKFIYHAYVSLIFIAILFLASKGEGTKKEVEEKAKSNIQFKS